MKEKNSTERIANLYETSRNKLEKTESILATIERCRETQKAEVLSVEVRANEEAADAGPATSEDGDSGEQVKEAKTGPFEVNLEKALDQQVAQAAEEEAKEVQKEEAADDNPFVDADDVNEEDRALIDNIKLGNKKEGEESEEDQSQQEGEVAGEPEEEMVDPEEPASNDGANGNDGKVISLENMEQGAVGEMSVNEDVVEEPVDEELPGESGAQDSSEEATLEIPEIPMQEETGEEVNEDTSLDGADGAHGQDGEDGQDGRDGRDGQDGGDGGDGGNGGDAGDAILRERYNQIAESLVNPFDIFKDAFMEQQQRLGEGAGRADQLNEEGSTGQHSSTESVESSGPPSPDADYTPEVKENQEVEKSSDPRSSDSEELVRPEDEGSPEEQEVAEAPEMQDEQSPGENGKQNKNEVEEEIEKQGVQVSSETTDKSTRESVSFSTTNEEVDPEDIEKFESLKSKFSDLVKKSNAALQNLDQDFDFNHWLTAPMKKVDLTQDAVKTQSLNSRTGMLDTTISFPLPRSPSSDLDSPSFQIDPVNMIISSPPGSQVEATVTFESQPGPSGSPASRGLPKGQRDQLDKFLDPKSLGIEPNSCSDETHYYFCVVNGTKCVILVDEAFESVETKSTIPCRHLMSSIKTFNAHVEDQAIQNFFSDKFPANFSFDSF